MCIRDRTKAAIVGLTKSLAVEYAQSGIRVNAICPCLLYTSNCSAANPWNWFGSSTKVSEQGVGELTASTPLQEQAIADALDCDYRLRSGMKTANGNVVRFFEVMKGDNVAMVINGDQGTILSLIHI